MVGFLGSNGVTVGGWKSSKCTNVEPNFLYLTLIYLYLIGGVVHKDYILINYEKIGKRKLGAEERGFLTFFAQ